MCVGIGVNVIPPANGAIEADGKNAPIYLRDLPGAQDASPAEVAAAVLREYGPVYDAWRHEGVEPFLSESDAHAFLVDRTVRIAGVHGAVTCEGAVRGVDRDGRLVLATSEGERRIASGEAHLV